MLFPWPAVTAEFRDRMSRGDIVAARKAMVFVTGPDGTRRLEGDFIDRVTAAVIKQMLVAWDSTGLPTPAQIHTAELWEGVLNKLDGDDADALDKAVGPWVERVMRTARSTAPGFVHNATGIRVEVAEQDAAALVASGEFTREQVDDPKNGSPGTGTSSSASPGAEWPDDGDDGSDPADFELTRRYRWTPEQIAALPDGYAEEQLLKHAGWDEAVALLQKREQRRHAPKDTGPAGKPVYGMPGTFTP